MTSTVKNILKYLLLWLVGGTVYVLIEMLGRGRSHFSMFILGGVCFVVLGLINEVFSWNTPLLLQMGIGALGITTLEFICGCIVNIRLGWGVWDYSDLLFNFKGQVCLQFSFLWFLLSVVGIVLDDYLRYRFFREEKPRYKLL